MGQFADIVGYAWRKYVNPGDPSSGKHNPKKTDIEPLGSALDVKFDDVDSRISALVSGIQRKANIDVAVFTNVNISTGLEAGDVVNGVALIAGMRVCLMAQSSGATITITSGPYTFTNSPTNGPRIVQASGAAPRSTDMDGPTEFRGAYFFSRDGTVGKGSKFVCLVTGDVTVDTTPVMFALDEELDTSTPGAIDALRAGATVASAASLDLSAATGDTIYISDAAEAIEQITGLSANVKRTLVALVDGLVIRASANILLRGGYDLLLSANDALTVVSKGGGVVQAVLGETGPQIVRPADFDQPGIYVDPTDIVIDPKVFGDDDDVVHMPDRRIEPADLNDAGVYVDPTDIIMETAADKAIAELIESGGGSGGGGGWGPAYWAGQDAYGAAHAARVAARPVPDVARFYWDYNLIFAYGQSRSVGGVATPPATVTPPAWGITAKSVGTSVGSSDESNAFVPFGAIGDPSIGSFALQPLIATADIDDPGGGRREDPVTYTAVPTSGLGGERPVVGLTYSFFKQWNEVRGELTGNYDGRVPIAASQGFGGQLLEDLLSNSNIPSHPFSTKLRAEDYCTDLKAHVEGPLSSTIGIAAATGWQGEANANTAYATYLGLLGDWRTWLHVDLAAGIFGQTKMPVLILTQVTEHWATGKPAVPQAQLDFSLANEDVFISAPSYVTPGKMTIPADGVSLPSELNEHKGGYESRWHGEYDAKVLRKLFLENTNWEPMRLVAGAFSAGSPQVLLTWHTPVGPLAVRDCPRGYRMIELADWGITVKINGVEAESASRQVWGTNSILLGLTVSPAAGDVVTAEIAVDDGRSNIWDSDPAVGRFTYERNIRSYASSTSVEGSMTAHEIAIQAEVDAELGHLYGKPVPLFNAAVEQVFTLTEIAA